MLRPVLSICSLLAAAHLSAQPAVDHHMHLLRAAATPLPGFANAGEVMRQMDETGTRRGNPFRPAVANEYERVKGENDWTAEKAALYPERLVAFCGVNPLKDYALREIDRCAQDQWPQCPGHDQLFDNPMPCYQPLADSPGRI